MVKKGKIKFADPVKGYGYILADDAKDPSDTTYFRLDHADDADALVSGEDVVFEESSPTPRAKQATQVKRA